MQTSNDMSATKGIISTYDASKRLSFHETVIRTQKLMRVLKTMNTVGEIKPKDFAGFGMSDVASKHRRHDNAMIEKKAKEESSDTSSESIALASQDNTTSVTASARRIGQRFIILHYSPFKAVWDWVVILLVIYTAIITPYTISFLSDEDQKRTKLNTQASTRQHSRERTSAHVLVIIDVLVDMMFIFDILISFRTTFVLKETNEIVTNPILIAKHFVIDSWNRFGTDILGALPWDILFYGNGNHSSMRLANCFKLARLLRLVPFIQKFQKTEYRSAVLFFLMLLFAIAAHWLACIFHFIAIIERPNLQAKYSWLDHLADKYKMPYLSNDTLSGPDLKSKYLTALFFAMTSLTSVGFGNVAANTNGEKLFSILSMLAGSFLSASILGSVTTIIIKLYQGAEELKEMKQSIDDFIKHHRINKQLAKRMQESFERDWKNTKGIDMNLILKTFPECIQADICLHLNRELLNNCPVFEDANQVTLRTLALLFKSTHVPPSDNLIHQGDVINSIYFIREGQIEVLKDNELQAILGCNDIFGENPSIATAPGKSICTVRGLTYCTLNKINRDDLLHVLQLYPDFAKTFTERFRLTFDLRQCEFIEFTPFCKLDPDVQMLIRERNPKLQRKRRLTQRDNDSHRVTPSPSYLPILVTTDQNRQRAKLTTIELSPKQAGTSNEDVYYSQISPSTSITPLVQTTLPSISYKQHIKYEVKRLNQLDNLQNRLESLERTLSNKMKLLYDAANTIASVKAGATKGRH